MGMPGPAAPPAVDEAPHSTILFRLFMAAAAVLVLLMKVVHGGSGTLFGWKATGRQIADRHAADRRWILPHVVTTQMPC